MIQQIIRILKYFNVVSMFTRHCLEDCCKIGFSRISLILLKVNLNFIQVLGISNISVFSNASEDRGLAQGITVGLYFLLIAVISLTSIRKTLDDSKNH